MKHALKAKNDIRQPPRAAVHSLISKPLRSRYARDLQVEAEASGVRVGKSGKVPLHGKFLAWDDDDLVITSVNWAQRRPIRIFPRVRWAYISKPRISLRSA
jgi:hypothetical protein